MYFAAPGCEGPTIVGILAGTQAEPCAVATKLNENVGTAVGEMIDPIFQLLR